MTVQCEWQYLITMVNSIYSDPIMRQTLHFEKLKYLCLGLDVLT